MRRLLPLLLALPLAAQAGQADPPMTGAEFDAATLGKTIVYGSPSGPYGAEEYLSDHRVRWSFLDGDCLDGRWYVQGQEICFTYEDDGGLGPQCWQFRNGPTGLTAEFQNSDGSSGPLVALSTSQEPLYCKGPKVGV